MLDFFPPLSFFAHADPPALQTKKMPKSSPRVFPWPSLWLASLLILMVQSVLSSSSTYQRPAVAGKRQGFLERTLVLLDVNTRSSIRVLNENFLSLQLDPSIIRDGWLDFLRYKRTLSCLSSTSIYGCPPLKYLEVLLFITHAATLSELSWIDPARFFLTPGTKQSSSPY